MQKLFNNLLVFFERALKKAAIKEIVNRVEISKPITYGAASLNSEPWMIEVMSRCLSLFKGGVIDVGANIGQTLAKIKSIDANRNYFGFEPNPWAFQYLWDLVEPNNFGNCILFPVALHTQSTLMRLHLYGKTNFDAGATLIKDLRPDMEVTNVIFTPTMNIQSIPYDFKKEAIDIIKIDVEGGELDCLKSLTSLINLNHPLLIVEVLPVYSSENVQRLERQIALEQILKELDYAIARLRIGPNGNYLGATKISTIGIHSDLNSCEYIFYPRLNCEIVERLLEVQCS